MNIKRLLCCMSSMDSGGAEGFLMKQYRMLDRTKYQMDFCVNVQKKCFYDDEIESLGGRIYRIVPKSQDFKGSLKNLEKIVRENGYESVLCNSTKPGTVFELIAAKKGGATRLIYRSSSANMSGGLKTKILHNTVGRLAHIVPTVKIAPSTLAAEYCFGRGCISKGKAELLYNGIDISVFKYSDELRKATRRELGLNGEFTAVHIGRFSKVKNHSFLFEVFAELLKSKPDAKLILVGDGELENEFKQKAAQMHIEKNVAFLGLRRDIPAILAAGDVFIFPSIFEGMPNTVIEAQALSLHCVISDTITSEADITGLVEYLPLGNAKIWADAALKYSAGYERKDMSEVFIDKKYDTLSTSKEFVRHCFGE